MIVAGTGHRPDKLGGYGQEVADRLEEVAVAWLGDAQPERVISGGALGWDQALARAARRLNIPYTMALPFPGFEDRWPNDSKLALHGLMATAADTVFVKDGPYAAWKMQDRNKWMVDHCDTVLALWDGSAGGTGNCIAYANKVGKPIVNLWEMYARSSSV